MVLPIDAPIPGANFTADTRNYAWHRPPEYADYDEAVDYFISKLNEPEQQHLVMSMLQLKMDAASLTGSLLMQGISKGKVSIDLAILIAGPVARYIGIIAKEAGVKHKMVPSTDKDKMITPTSLRMALGILDDEDPDVAAPPPPPQPMPSGGLMGTPAPDEAMSSSDQEQASMLGMTNDEEEPQDGLA